MYVCGSLLHCFVVAISILKFKQLSSCFDFIDGQEPDIWQSKAT